MALPRSRFEAFIKHRHQDGSKPRNQSIQEIGALLRLVHGALVEDRVTEVERKWLVAFFEIEAIFIEPFDVEIQAEYYYIRSIYYLKNVEQSIADLTRSLQLNENVTVLMARGALHQNQGQFVLALKDFNRAVQIDPDNLLCVFNVIVCYFQQATSSLKFQSVFVGLIQEKLKKFYSIASSLSIEEKRQNRDIFNNIKLIKKQLRLDVSSDEKENKKEQVSFSDTKKSTEESSEAPVVSKKKKKIDYAKKAGKIFLKNREKISQCPWLTSDVEIIIEIKLLKITFHLSNDSVLDKNLMQLLKDAGFTIKDQCVFIEINCAEFQPKELTSIIEKILDRFLNIQGVLYKKLALVSFPAQLPPFIYSILNFSQEDKELFLKYFSYSDLISFFKESEGRYSLLQFVSEMEILNWIILLRLDQLLKSKYGQSLFIYGSSVAKFVLKKFGRNALFQFSDIDLFCWADDLNLLKKDVMALGFLETANPQNGYSQLIMNPEVGKKFELTIRDRKYYRLRKDPIHLSRNPLVLNQRGELAFEDKGDDIQDECKRGYFVIDLPRLDYIPSKFFARVIKYYLAVCDVLKLDPDSSFKALKDEKWISDYFSSLLNLEQGIQIVFQEIFEIYKKGYLFIAVSEFVFKGFIAALIKLLYGEKKVDNVVEKIMEAILVHCESLIKDVQSLYIVVEFFLTRIHSFRESVSFNDLDRGKVALFLNPVNILQTGLDADLKEKLTTQLNRILFGLSDVNSVTFISSSVSPVEEAKMAIQPKLEVKGKIVLNS